MTTQLEVTFRTLRCPKSTARFAEWDESMDLEQVTCPLNEGHRRGGRRSTDLRLLLPGTRVEDIVWTWYSECLVQDRVLDLFRGHGVTGYEVKPARAMFKDERAGQAPRLWELVVTGWAGMAPPESGITLIERCSACRHTVYSGCTTPERLIDRRQWDGSDVFMVWPLPRFIFVTDRVANLLRRAGLSGVQLQSVKSLDLSGPLGPGLLSYTLPESLAAERSAALGID